MILNIYKEKNWTSNDVVSKIKSLLRQKYKKKIKVGHAGTLDPLAEGVLIVLTDTDTKRQNELMISGKEYIADIAFGFSSETYDLEGPFKVNTLPEHFNLESLLPEALQSFIGDIEQTVPLYSAVKMDGSKLYDLARSGKGSSVILPKRPITITNIHVMSYINFTLEGINYPAVTLKISCSKGTYIRSLANDLGNFIGYGGVLIKLIRTKVGNYSVENSAKLSELSL